MGKLFPEEFCFVKKRMGECVLATEITKHDKLYETIQYQVKQF